MKIINVLKKIVNYVIEIYKEENNVHYVNQVIILNLINMDKLSVLKKIIDHKIVNLQDKIINV